MARLGREPAPPGLAERIRVTLAEERGAEERGSQERGAEQRGPEQRDAGDRAGTVIPFTASPRWRGFVQQFASMAAVCLLSVFGTWAVMHQPGSMPETEHDVVAAHVRSLLQNSTIQVVSSDQHTVRPWFNGKVEFAPPVKDLTAEGFPLYGGRLDYVDGHRVATLVYHHGPHTISVFVWPEASPTSAPPLLNQMDGLNVLSWTKDGMVWWAVSDMEQSEMKELRALL
jgi:anti-sigma factor RsiW